MNGDEEGSSDLPCTPALVGNGLLVLHAYSVLHRTTHGPEAGTLSSTEISREQRFF